MPTDLAMWLIGLGPEMIWNPPRQPQKNGKVERSQGTAQRWCEAQRCPDAAELQRRLDEMDHVQRELYPVEERQGAPSRWDLFTGLHHSGIDLALALSSWNRDRVAEHLTRYTLKRRVGPQGKISVRNQGIHVGSLLKGTLVFVQYDPYAQEWVVRNAEGAQIRTCAAKIIHCPDTSWPLE